MNAVLSIQSEVAYGHVGNSAASLPLQRLGFEFWPVNTVQLGHHPGYGRFAGFSLKAACLQTVLDGVLQQAPLDRCKGMIAGYLGDALIADQVLRARETIIERRPDLVFLLDPVMGDDGSGLFVQPDVPAAIVEHLLPCADIVTPNRFELAHLSGLPIDNLSQATLAAESLLQQGPDLIIATGLPSPNGRDELAMLAVSADQRLIIRTPRLPRGFSGTGDAFSALLLGHYLLTQDLKTTFERAATGIFAIVELTANRGEEELCLVEAQDHLARPDIRFSAASV